MNQYMGAAPSILSRWYISLVVSITSGIYNATPSVELDRRNPPTTSSTRSMVSLVKQLKKCCYRLHFSGMYVGTTPQPVTVTTRILPFVVGNPYKPSFVTGILGGGWT